MGGLCSKSEKGDKAFTKSKVGGGHYDDNHKSGGGGGGNNHKKQHTSDLATAAAREGMEKKKQEEPVAAAADAAAGAGEGNSPDDFYDGIPRYSDSLHHKSRSVRSRQGAVAKVGWLMLPFPFCLITCCFCAQSMD